MSRRATAAMIAALLIGAALPVRAEPAKDAETRAAAAPATSQPATTRPAKRVADFIAQVRQAAHPREAVTAYARGCAVDRLNVELHNAHMRRMLQLGQPQLAYFPAQTLVRIQPENGTAWGVLGYMHARRGNFGQALLSTIRAARLVPGDPSVLHNAAQLLAWYERQMDPPQLPGVDEPILDRLREELSRRETFAKTYRATQAAYGRQPALSDAYRSRLDSAEADRLALEDKALDLDGKIRELNQRVREHRREIARLRRQMERAYAWSYVLFGQEVPKRDDPYIDRRRTSIHELTIGMDRLHLRIRKLRRHGEPLLQKLQANRAALERIGREMEQALAKVAGGLRWNPPAVDGVVTAEAAYLPPPPAEEGSVPKDPESAAEKRLDMARLYIRNDLRERAAEILGEIVKTYGTTKAAEEARVLLAGLKAAK